MERQVHRHIETTQRWLAVDKIKTDLDNEVRVTRQTTPFCLACMTEVGFSFNNAYTGRRGGLQAARKTKTKAMTPSPADCQKDDAAIAEVQTELDQELNNV